MTSYIAHYMIAGGDEFGEPIAMDRGVLAHIAPEITHPHEGGAMHQTMDNAPGLAEDGRACQTILKASKGNSFDVD